MKEVFCGKRSFLAEWNGERCDLEEQKIQKKIYKLGFSACLE